MPPQTQAKFGKRRLGTVKKTKLTSTGSKPNHHLWPKIQGLVSVGFGDPNIFVAAEFGCHDGILASSDLQILEELETLVIKTGSRGVGHDKAPFHLIKIGSDFLVGK